MKIKDDILKTDYIKHFACYISDTKAIITDDPDNKGLTFGRVPFVLTTTDIDESGEVLVSMGADLKRFKRNPIVAWAHNVFGGIFSSVSEDDIIGKIDVSTLKKSENEVTGDVLFNLTKDDDGVQDPRAVKIFNKLNAGVINAGSVGFKSITRTTKNPKPGQTGVTHLKWELVEFSIVPLGMNTFALQKSLDNADDEQRELIYKEIFDNSSNEQIIEFAQKIMGINGTHTEKDLYNNVDAIDIVQKAGRTLSKANETKLRNANNKSQESINKAQDSINDIKSVLDSLKDLHADDENKPKPSRPKAGHNDKPKKENKTTSDELGETYEIVSLSNPNYDKDEYNFERLDKL